MPVKTGGDSSSAVLHFITSLVAPCCSLGCAAIGDATRPLLPASFSALRVLGVEPAPITNSMLRLINTLGLIALLALFSYPALLWCLAYRPGWLLARSWQRISQLLAGMAGLGLLLIIAALALPAIFRQASGPPALLQVLAPYLALPALLIFPLAFVARSRWLWLLLALCGVVAIMRSPPSLGALLPHPESESLITVFHWNVAIDGEERQRSRLQPLLAMRPADIVVLPEAYWGWMRTDSTIAKLYPYQLVHTEQASSGLVLLSAFPFLEADVARNPPGARGWPRLLWARLDLGNGEHLLVVAAHPESPYSSNSDCALLVCYDTAERDSLTPRIRELIDPALTAGESVLLVGDLNITDREPGYSELSRGLHDLHRRAGLGWGHSWGIYSEPASSNAPVTRGVLPLLRIDYIFASPDLIPLGSSVDCSVPGSDHCALQGSFARPSATP